MSNTTDIFDVIIIGSGVGGLTAGLTLQTLDSNLETLILEQHNAPGGYISGFKRKGYYFDSGAEGLVYCGEGQSFRNALDSINVHQDFLEIDPIEVLHYSNKTITMYSNAEKYKEELIKNFPANKSEIMNFFQVLESMHKEYTDTVKKGINPTPKEFVKIALTCPNLRKYAFRTFKEFLDEFITNEQLKEVLSVYSLWLGLPPESIRAVSAGIVFFSPVFDGHYYPKGGMLAFAENLANTFIERGGTIKYKSKVTKIIIEKRKATGVILSDGTVIEGKKIISNADLKQTLFNYVGESSFPKNYQKRIKNLSQSVSGFAVYLGLDKELTEYPSHMAYNIKAEKHIKNILKDEYNPKEVLLRIPSKIDPELSLNGKTSVILLSLAPYNFENNWNTGENNDRTQEYRDTKSKYAAKLIKLAENLIPDLSKHITIKVISSPLSFERHTLNSQGAWYGPKQGKRKINFKTPIKNLVLTGANVEGAGVPPSFFSGIKTAKFVYKKLTKCKKSIRILFHYSASLDLK